MSRKYFSMAYFNDLVGFSGNPSVASRFGYFSGGHLLNAEEHVAGDALTVSQEAELDLLVPDPSIAASGN